MAVHVFGIRHHGPGCARALRAALQELEPDVVAIEAPADAQSVVPLVAAGGLKPPVALLVYRPDIPRRAAVYPLAEFSPEWQALRWALAAGVPVRLMDLPQSHSLAVEAAENENAARESAEPEAAPGRGTSEQPHTPSGGEDETPEQHATVRPGKPPELRSDPQRPRWRTDPLAVLAEAAGYEDAELWWEEQIERRTEVAGLFQAIVEAMQAVRNELGESDEHHLLREAFMRRTLRAILREGFRRIAVVCGAWHAPVLGREALEGKCKGLRAKDDSSRLRGLPKCKTQATWIPWTYWRMTYHTGYRAGVASPGWYEHLWRSPQQAPIRWVATAARLLRGKDLDASSASVIEAVRLAEALAALRNLRGPGLAELNEAILAVLCGGDCSPMRLVYRELQVGRALGEVPPETPCTPLAGDLQQRQKRLRLKPSAEVRHLDLDLRKANDLARSHLLHQLRLLDIPWGEPVGSGGRQSTFHEIWQLEWKPEFAIAVIEANVWGNTVEAAAAAKTIDQAEQSDRLPEITELLDRAILAGLTGAIDPLLRRVHTQAAVAADVRHLMDAILPLGRIARYGDVRGTDPQQVMPILRGMFERVLVGLPAACSALNDEAAERMLESVGRVQETLDLLDLPEMTAPWHERLTGLMHSDVHSLLRGWCCRLLLEKGVVGEDDLYRAARLALSPANPPAQCAAWATGLLRGSGMLLLQYDSLWRTFDRWLCELPEDVFREMLPLLRRALADFTPAERRQMGEKVRHLLSAPATVSTARGAVDRSIDYQRAQLALPVLAHILGIDGHARGK